MKITHVAPQVAREAAGPSYSVPRLCQALAECGNDVELKCIAASGPIPGVQLSTYPGWPVLKRFEVTAALAIAVHKADDRRALWSAVVRNRRAH